MKLRIILWGLPHTYLHKENNKQMLWAAYPGNFIALLSMIISRTESASCEMKKWTPTLKFTQNCCSVWQYPFTGKAWLCCLATKWSFSYSMLISVRSLRVLTLAPAFMFTRANRDQVVPASSLSTLQPCFFPLLTL